MFEPSVSRFCVLGFANSVEVSDLVMEPLPQIRTTAQAELVSAIEQWCSEKGTDLYVDQLLGLVDTEFLRTWGGLAHVKFPKLSSRLPSGKIPNRHWRYRTHGDDQYFDDIFHSKVKLVWPDEDFIREVPPINRDEQSAETQTCPAEIQKEVSIPIGATQQSTCIVRCIAQIYVHPFPLPNEQGERKRRRLPAWITASPPPETCPEASSSGSSGSDSSGSSQ
ncbi:hypothetical protein R1sor_012194 [Riccia sorocarpa]|uniref:Uncharacterized protein n=1 Tax=Riccia sorocarpa TaxID=122646 RepID=A0ABD3I335_9MARC